jgi:hypothetical protein
MDPISVTQWILELIVLHRRKWEGCLAGPPNEKAGTVALYGSKYWSKYPFQVPRQSQESSLRPINIGYFVGVPDRHYLKSAIHLRSLLSAAHEIG